MDDETRRFVTTFRTFLAEVVHQVREESDQVQPLLPVLQEHLGIPPRSVPVVTEQVSPLRFADADVALEPLPTATAAAGSSASAVGWRAGTRRWPRSSRTPACTGVFPVGTVDYARAPTGPDTSRQVVAFGLHLFAHDGVPLVVLQEKKPRSYPVRMTSSWASVRMTRVRSGPLLSAAGSSKA